MTVEISCPAKTFVLGEYAVLDGGSAILVNTSPRFSCRIKKENPSSHSDLKGPAFQWIQNHWEDFKDVSLDWFDPYKGQGGFGFSSAQFNVVYFYHFISQGMNPDNFDSKKLWKAYRGLSHEGLTPSGADIVSQWVGGICIFEQNPLSFQNVTFPFADLEFGIFRTGKSLKTHLHLKELKLPPMEDLNRVAQKGVESLEDRNQNLFLESINHYGKLLRKKGLVADHTLELTEELSGVREILALKGCGAMGADGVIIFYPKEKANLIKQKTSHLSFVADTSQLTYGMDLKEESSPNNLLSH